jgi:hypothetical protein
VLVSHSKERRISVSHNRKAENEGNCKTLPNFVAGLAKRCSHGHNK